MGAICGFFKMQADTTGWLEAMTGTMAVRGTDGVVNAALTPQEGLGYCHLSVDPRVRPIGHHVAGTPDGKIYLTADTDIINLAELAISLAPASEAALAETPATLLLRLYQQHSLEFIDRIRGVFAIAIIDREKETLFLIRDRLGVKPLYFARKGKGVVFASEIKALLATGQVAREVNQTAIHHYLTYQYVPYPETAFVGVKKIPPATCFQFSETSILQKKYWELSFLPKTTQSYEKCQTQLREMTEDSAQRMLKGLSSYGLFLSGGIDSSLMTGLLTKLAAAAPPVFSIGFEKEEFNELPQARETARQYGSTMTELMMTPKMIDTLPEIVRAYEEPYADSSSLPTFAVSRLASEKVRVVFLGDGGDDSFAGYLRYWAMQTAGRLDVVPGAMMRPLANLLLKMIPQTTNQRSLLGYGRRFIDLLSLPPRERYGKLMCHFTNKMKIALYSDDFYDRMQKVDSFAFMNNIFDQPPAEYAMLDRLLYTDLATYMPGDLVVKVEVAAAANRLIARAPLLDHKIIEFAASLPTKYKLQGKKGKMLLRDTFAEYIPPEILKRRKTGFGAPIGTWFREELKGYIREQLLDSKLSNRGYFRRDAIERLINEHASGLFNHGYPLWNLLMLELWHREFIDTKP